ncbi:MAG: 1-acyl-sn-glycerol-3-phosphate acyltransferase (EC [uncultured Sulfurovum sp.]|uniref:1-acyl-sn-glycerol-3-phosphate acyltransferase (EC) n=1 Tax=uncultured Sulfurovum sp. TaxID=269237 RepID=A0A6S6TTY9_9BACT|nr:MAG: 1-acyl-sn-glycerol-3-phosphate acyltransferase (EC [uncultured Sulfurovum sp.]
MKILAKIRFYWGAFVISFNTAVFMIPALMLFGKYKSTIVHHINSMTLWMMGGIALKKGKLDKSADMYVMNHQGIVDIIGLEAVQNNHMRWAAKKELFDAIWFGNLLRHGEMISVDRQSRTSMVKFIKDVEKSRDVYKRPVAIFPEGTRTDGQPLLNFKKGTKIIAEKLGLKIQPIVITGSKKLLNEHNKTAHSAIVHYHFLPTVDVQNANENWYETMKNDMQKVIDYEFTHNRRSR